MTTTSRFTAARWPAHPDYAAKSCPAFKSFHRATLTHPNPPPRRPPLACVFPWQDNFIESETFEELSAYVLQHPFVGNWTNPQREAQVVSRVHPWAHCNDKGFYKLCASSDIRFLCDPFLKKVRQKGTNAFVIKLFAGYASDYDAKPSYFYSSLGMQGSDGPQIEDGDNRWMPKVVNVLDIQVPNSMRGGQLQVLEDTNLQERESWNINTAGAARVEKPAANTLHTLRGDMWYTFSDYTIAGLVEDAWLDMPSDFRCVRMNALCWCRLAQQMPRSSMPCILLRRLRGCLPHQTASECLGAWGPSGEAARG